MEAQGGHSSPNNNKRLDSKKAHRQYTTDQPSDTSEYETEDNKDSTNGEDGSTVDSHSTPPSPDHVVRPSKRLIAVPFIDDLNLNERKNTTKLIPGGKRILTIPFNLVKQGRIDDTHCIGILGSDMTQADRDVKIPKLRKAIMALRNQIHAYASSVIRQMIISKAQILQMKNPLTGRGVSNFDDFLSSFKRDPSRENLAHIWVCMYGIFELRSMWALELEREYMEIFKIQYESIPFNRDDARRGPKPKGCIARCATSVKNHLVKQINRTGKRTHGLSLRKTVPVGRRTNRRDPGEFEDGFVVGKLLEHPADRDSEDPSSGSGDDSDDSMPNLALVEAGIKKPKIAKKLSRPRDGQTRDKAQEELRVALEHARVEQDLLRRKLELATLKANRDAKRNNRDRRRNDEIAKGLALCVENGSSSPSSLDTGGIDQFGRIGVRATISKRTVRSVKNKKKKPPGNNTGTESPTRTKKRSSTVTPDVRSKGRGKGRAHTQECSSGEDTDELVERITNTRGGGGGGENDGGDDDGSDDSSDGMYDSEASQNEVKKILSHFKRDGLLYLRVMWNNKEVTSDEFPGLCNDFPELVYEYGKEHQIISSEYHRWLSSQSSKKRKNLPGVASKPTRRGEKLNKKKKSTKRKTTVKRKSNRKPPPHTPPQRASLKDDKDYNSDGKPTKMNNTRVNLTPDIQRESTPEMTKPNRANDKENENSTTMTNNRRPKKQRVECDLDHHDFAPEATYREEPLSTQCKPNMRYFNSKCFLCDCLMIHYMGQIQGNERWFKPSTKTPMFICRNYTKKDCNCPTVVCFDCANAQQTTVLLTDSDGRCTGERRSKRNSNKQQESP